MPKDSSRVSDGASLRNSRIKHLLQWLAQLENGATMKEIQSFMLVHHGLKFSTTADYVWELHLAGILYMDEKERWHISDGYRKYL